MLEVHVTIAIHASQDEVFALVSDHERFLTGRGASCRLVNTGKEHRNGVGAVREVKAMGGEFTEEVIEFDPPRQFAYVIRKLIGPMGRPAPFKHERGWMEFRQQGDETHVDWRTRFGLPIPLIGRLLERVAARRVRKAFEGFLSAAKAELER